MPNLSPQDIARIDHALDAAKVKRKCVACGSSEVKTDDEMRAHWTARHAATAGAEATGTAMMCVSRVCQRCGHVMFFSVVVLGLDSMM
jgi:hypothetical protein